MIHAETILRTLDRSLDRSIPLVLYGRAALALGFDHPPEEACRSLDVDVILTLAQADQLDGDAAFLLSQPEAEGVDFHDLFSQARVPDVPEIRALFNEAQPVILRLA